MRTWSRRDVVKGGLLAAGAALVPTPAKALLAADGTARAAAGPWDEGALPPGALPAVSVRERLLLDFDWRFHLGHAGDPEQDFGFGSGNDGIFAKTGYFFRPASPKFDASDWRAVDLPHDWVVELPFVNDPELTSHGFKPVGRNYPATSIGWYRKTFALSAADAGRRLWLEFDGVYRNAIVTLNGVYLATAASGYAPFRVDITDVAHSGADNLLVLRVDATENEGWFYEGAGIYRHVWLVKTAPVHVPQWGTYVTSDVRGNAARLHLETTVVNEADTNAACRVISRLLDESGASRASAVAGDVRLAPWGTATVNQSATIANPQLWSVDTPHLYSLHTSIEVNGQVVDDHVTPFGVRTMHFDADRGFFLNGEHVELKGTCNHQDHAGVGSALPDRLQYFRIARLKEMGCNAYRTSHNPPTPELPDACDRLGMLVLDETRMFSSSEEGLSQFERLVLRDRNHPSVFCWSIGNEEPLQGTDEGARIATRMKRLARRLDPSRPITEAMNNSNSWGKGLSAVVDVQGFNYGDGARIDAFHTEFPAHWTMGTETASTVSTRGIYANDKDRGYVEAYDTQFPPWATTAERWWGTYAARPFLAGGFAWTGFDYRGEPTPYGWPCINSHFGIVDTCGFPKDNFYYYQAWWGAKPVVHLFPHWNWPGQEGRDVRVWAHTNAEQVELFVNGKSAGRLDVKPNTHAEWRVPYQPGTIEARGYRNGRVVASDARETTGAPARITLTPDRATIDADGEDVSVVTVQVLDAQGRLVPVANDEIEFAVTGAGRLIGLGNGDPSDHGADKGTVRRVFNGLGVAIVQASKQAGTLQLRAAANGLAPATATITCAPATPRPSA
ncbi:MAG TPA: beta-galactosidase GalA [Gemmatimonadaceae bacterium]